MKTLIVQNQTPGPRLCRPRPAAALRNDNATELFRACFFRNALRLVLGEHSRGLVLLGLALLFIGGTNLSADAPTAKEPACCSKELSASHSISDNSLYQIESTWTNDSGKSIAFSSLRGKPQLVTMFFASCEFACPILVHDLERIAKALPETVRSKVGFTLVSFDTERDTPEALNEFRAARKIDPRWNLLTGNPDDILELAALLGVKYKKDTRGQYAHSNIITLLNADGEIVRQQIGLNQSVDEIARAVESLLTEKPGAESHAHLP